MTVVGFADAGLGDEALQGAVHTGSVRAKGTITARDFGNEPPQSLRPIVFAERVAAHFAGSEVKVDIFRGADLQTMQMNGIIAVGKGSANGPAYIELKYCTDPSLPLIALVGKGITFDTGGISLKSGRDISDMRIDMGGAAAVVGAFDIIASAGIRANVVGLIAAAENMPSGTSLLPGEVISYRNGVSVQVGNTDAEGRLVLADALIRAHELGAAEAVDIATLTGACGVALGVRIAGLWGEDELVSALSRAGAKSGDKVWPMPLEDDYESTLSSHYADTNNISTSPYGGAITAALFLRKFVDRSMKWAHVDMAGPKDIGSTKGYLIEGATGFGSRLLADFVAERVGASV